MSEATDVVDAQIDAYKARDIDLYLSHFAEDASVMLFDGTYMMPDKLSMRDVYGRLFAQSPDLEVAVVNRIAVGDTVVDEEHLTNFNFEAMPSELSAIAAYRVANGKIARMLFLT